MREFMTDTSDIILAAGRGVSEEGAGLLRELAELINGEAVATRGAVEKGLFPYEAEVGIGGKKVFPILYVSFGTSGAYFHMAGVKTDCPVVTINKDHRARSMEIADHAICAEANSVLADMVSEIKAWPETDRNNVEKVVDWFLHYCATSKSAIE